MKYKILIAVFLYFPVGLLAQSAYKGLMPGSSSRADVERVLGQPVSVISETLSEYGPQSNAAKIYVQYRADSVVQRIELLLAKPTDPSELRQSMQLQNPSASEIAKQKLLEYYADPHYIVLTYSNEDAASGVRRIGYYSKALFQTASAKAAATPAAKTPPGATSGSPSTPTQPSDELGPAQDGWGFNPEIATVLTYYGSTSADTCRQDCEKNPKCAAYSWIRPNGILKGDPPMCYLMSSWVRMMQHPCCISAGRESMRRR